MNDGLQDLRVADVNWSGDGFGNVRFQQGARVVLFYNKSVHNPAKSAEEGRPVFSDSVYLKSYVPGEQRFEVVDRPANTRDKQMYAQQWNAFIQNRNQTPEGTPIGLLYPERPSIAATLEANGVHTIEQCAALNATSIDNIGMGAQSWVNDANRYIDVANKGVSAVKLRKELDERDSRIRVLEHTIEQLKEQVDLVSKSTGPETQGVDPALVQAVIAQMQGIGGNRPLMPTSPKSKVFDAQTAQINATHVSGDIAKTKKTRRAKAGA